MRNRLTVAVSVVVMLTAGMAMLAGPASAARKHHRHHHHGGGSTTCGPGTELTDGACVPTPAPTPES